MTSVLEDLDGTHSASRVTSVLEDLDGTHSASRVTSVLEDLDETHSASRVTSVLEDLDETIPPLAATDCAGRAPRGTITGRPPPADEPPMAVAPTVTTLPLAATDCAGYAPHGPINRVRHKGLETSRDRALNVSAEYVELLLAINRAVNSGCRPNA